MLAAKSGAAPCGTCGILQLYQPDHGAGSTTLAANPDAFDTFYRLQLCRPEQVLYVTDPAEAERRVRSLEGEAVLGLDTETTGLDPLQHRLRLVQLAVSDGRVLMLDMRTVPAAVLQPLRSVPLVMHNALFDVRFLIRSGFEPRQVHCTMLMHRCVSGQPLVALAAAAQQLLSVTLDKSEQTSDWTDPELSRQQLCYAADDAMAALRLAEVLLPLLQQAGVTRSYRWARGAIVPLSKMMLRGVAFDWNAHTDIVAGWEVTLQAATEAAALALPGVNLRSPKQVAAWLTSTAPEEVLTRWPRTGGGQLCTDETTLGQRGGDLPQLQPLLQVRGLDKLVSTYGHGYRTARHPADERIHADFRLLHAITGRMACSDPNLQNPPRPDTAPLFRNCFMPTPGNVLLVADFSQIEMRIAAVLSGDRAMLQAFRDGADLHKLTAAKLRGCSLEDVGKPERTAAKRANFGQLYGLSPGGLQRQVAGLTFEQARAYLNAVSAAYPQLAVFLDEQVRLALGGHAVRTVGGLFRTFTDSKQISYVKGQARNFTVQGSAADLLHATLCRLDPACEEMLVLLVHDELVLDVPEPALDDVEAALLGAMRAAWCELFPSADWMAPHIAETARAASWGAAKG